MGGVRARPTHRSQAELVSAWLGTYALLLEGLREDLGMAARDVTTGVPGLPSPDAIAGATTEIMSMADLEQPWMGRS